MEVNNNEVGESHVPVQVPQPEVATLDIIRTETVLSRLPIHNLAKKGSVNIQILKTTPAGKVELKWIVSYSDRYGQARQLAYKLDTIVINQHIDETGRPIPKMICLGSLRDIANELDLGGDTNKVRRALRQNASAFITAKFEYPGNDGSKKTLEADFTRYSVVFTGEQLPDGRRADAVYIIFNEPYREVLNNAPVRPLDRAYMKALPPGAQRFYEIVSYKIFSALKNHYPTAKILYSEYCTFSAQLRHFTRQTVQDQMAKVLRPHKTSGYITSVKYEATIDEQNKPDWVMHLAPGPKASMEFALAHNRRRDKKVGERLLIASAGQLPKYLQSKAKRTAVEVRPGTPIPAFDPQLIAEFTSRGITQQKAEEVLRNSRPGQDVVAQLEITDNTIKYAGFTIKNPAGFYIRQIERNLPVPDNFETSAKRKAREEKVHKEQERRAAEDAREELEWEHENFCEEQIDRYITQHPTEFETIKEAKWKYDRENYSFSSEGMARAQARNEIRKLVNLPTLEEYLAYKKSGTPYRLTTTAPSAEAESSAIDLASTSEKLASVAEFAMTGEPAVEFQTPVAADNNSFVVLPDSDEPIPADSELSPGGEISSTNEGQHSEQMNAIQSEEALVFLKPVPPSPVAELAADEVPVSAVPSESAPIVQPEEPNSADRENTLEPAGPTIAIRGDVDMKNDLTMFSEPGSDFIGSELG